MKKVLNFGSLNIDYVYDVPHFVRPGETLQSQKLSVFCGGKGLNQSTALARAGVLVYHAGCVGKTDGKILTDMLLKEGVDIRHVLKTDVRSGNAIIQVDETGQNCILLYAGANHEISNVQINTVFQDFGEGDILLLQNEISGIDMIMAEAKKHRLRIFLNPSPCNASVLKLPLQLVDTFILNEVEGADIADCASDDFQQIMAKLREKFPAAKIVLTLGGRGVCCFDGNSTVFRPAYRVNVIDTTAAGDTFTGFYIAGVMAGQTTEKMLDTASKAAALAVSRKGASASIPTMAEVEAAVWD